MAVQFGQLGSKFRKITNAKGDYVMTDKELTIEQAAAIRAAELGPEDNNPGLTEARKHTHEIYRAYKTMEREAHARGLTVEELLGG